MCQPRTTQCKYCNYTRSKWSKCSAYYSEHTRLALASFEGIILNPDDCPEGFAASSSSDEEEEEGVEVDEAGVKTFALGDCPRLHTGCPSLKVLARIKHNHFEEILKQMEAERDEAIKNLDWADKGGGAMRQQQHQQQQQPREFIGAPIQANPDFKRRMDEEWKRAREREAIQRRRQEETPEGSVQSEDHVVVGHDGSPDITSTLEEEEDGFTRHPKTPEDQGMLGVLGSWITKTLMPITKVTRILLDPFNKQQRKVRRYHHPTQPAPIPWDITVELTPWDTTADDNTGHELPAYGDGQLPPPNYQPGEDGQDLAVPRVQPPPPLFIAYAQTELIHPRRPAVPAANVADVLDELERGILEQEIRERQEKKKNNYLNGIEMGPPPPSFSKALSPPTPPPFFTLQIQDDDDTPIQPPPGFERWTGTFARRKNHRNHQLQGWGYFDPGDFLLSQHDTRFDTWLGQSSQFYWGPGDDSVLSVAQPALNERQSGPWNHATGYHHPTGYDAYYQGKEAPKSNPYGSVGDGRPLPKTNPQPPPPHPVAPVCTTQASCLDSELYRLIGFAHEDFEPSETSSGSDFGTNYQVSPLSWNDEESHAASHGSAHYLQTGSERQTIAMVPRSTNMYNLAQYVRGESKLVPAKVVLGDPEVGQPQSTPSGTRDSWIYSM